MRSTVQPFVLNSEIVIEKVENCFSRESFCQNVLYIFVLKSDEERHLMNNRIMWIVVTVEKSTAFFQASNSNFYIINNVLVHCVDMPSK